MRREFGDWHLPSPFFQFRLNFRGVTRVRMAKISAALKDNPVKLLTNKQSNND